jgi:hypothetical protein
MTMITNSSSVPPLEPIVHRKIEAAILGVFDCAVKFDDGNGEVEPQVEPGQRFPQ